MKATEPMKTRSRTHSHQQPGLVALTSCLRRQSRKITGPRRAILEILRKHPHPLTNREILAALPGRRCDLTTIYRAMHLLEEIGLVRQFDFGDGKARFELVGGRGMAIITTSFVRDARKLLKSRSVFWTSSKSRLPPKTVLPP